MRKKTLSVIQEEESVMEAPNFDGMSFNHSLFNNDRPAGFKEVRETQASIIPSSMYVRTQEAQIHVNELVDLPQMYILKSAFKDKHPLMMTNILRVALQKQEERLACFIIAGYHIEIPESLISHAIEKEQYEFLFWFFAYGKN